MASRGKKKIEDKVQTDYKPVISSSNSELNDKFNRAYPIIITIVLCLLLICQFIPFIQITIDAAIDDEGTLLSESISVGDRTFGISLFEIVFTPASEYDNAIDYIVSKVKIGGASLPLTGLADSIRENYLTVSQIENIENGYQWLWVLSLINMVAVLSLVVTLIVKVYVKKVDLKLALLILSGILLILALVGFVAVLISIGFGNANFTIGIGVGEIILLIITTAFAGFTVTEKVISHNNRKEVVNG